MKQKRKHLLKKFLIFGIAFLLASCSEELFDEAIGSSNKKTIKEVKFNELYKDSKFKNLLQKISHTSNAARTSFENQNGFTISDGFVKVIETDSVVSYTMLIERDVVTDTISFENLVIQENSLGIQKAKILKYTPTIIELSGHNSYFFEGNIKMNRLAFTGFNKSSSYSNATQAECYTYVDQLWCSQPYDGSTRHHLAGPGCKIGTLYVKKVLVPDDCGSTGGDNTGGTGGPSDGGLGDPYSNPGGDGANTSNTETTTDEDLITSPVKPGLNGVMPVKTPCEELKKLNANNSIQLTLRILKGQSSGQAEHGNYISETTNSVGVTYLSFPVVPQSSNNPNEIDISAGLATGKVKGVMHCHINPTTGMIPMFSAADLGALYGIAYSHNPSNNTEKDYAEYTVMLSVGSGHYALKFKNFDGQYGNFNNNFDQFKKDLQEECRKITSMASAEQQQKTFLKNMNKFFAGTVGLYKATETTNANGVSNITGWSEQTLNESGDIVPIDCQ